MPTINIRGANARGTGSPYRGTPMMDPLKWSKALNDIEKYTKKTADLTAGTTPAIGGIRIPREQQQIDRDLKRLISIMERQARGSGAYSPTAMFRQARGYGTDAYWRARLSGTPYSFYNPRARSPRDYFTDGPHGGFGGTFGGYRGGVLGGLGLGSLGRAGVGGFSLFEIARFLSNPFAAIHGLESSALSASQKYMNLRLGAFSQARAGGFGGQALEDLLYPGAGKQMPEWMKALNLSATSSLGLLQNYGIAPRSAEQAKGIMQSLGYYENVAPGFAGMAPGSATGAANQAAALGLVGAGGTPSNYLANIGQVLEEAVSKGMDRARVLSSIQDTLSTMERSGALSMSAGGNMDLFTRLMMGGTPGGRTGALQSQTAAGISGALGNLPNNSQAMMMIQNAFSSTPPTSVGNVAKLLGMSEKDLQEQMKSNPTMASTVEGLISDYKQGKSGLAMLLFGELLKGNQGAYANLTTNYVNKVGLGNNPANKALVYPSFGIPYAAGNALQGTGTLSSGGKGLFNPGNLKNPNGSGFANFATPEAGIMALQNQLIRDETIHGQNTLRQLIYGNKQWPGYSTTDRASYLQNLSKITGLGPDDLLDPSNQQQMIKLMTGITKQEGNTPMSEDQIAGILKNNQNIPTDVFGATGTVEQQEMASSATRFEEFGSHLFQLNDALNTLTTTVEKATQSYSKFLMKSSPDNLLGGPWANPFPGVAPPM